MSAQGWRDERDGPPLAMVNGFRLSADVLVRLRCGRVAVAYLAVTPGGARGWFYADDGRWTHGEQEVVGEVTAWHQLPSWAPPGGQVSADGRGKDDA